MGWRTFRIRAIYKHGERTLPCDIDAPDLETAFNIARAWWPGARAWESL